MTDQETIIISKSDLRDPKIEDALIAQRAAKRQLSPSERAPVVTAFWMNPVFYTSFAGLTGAFVAWASLEPFVIKENGSEKGPELFLMLIAVPALIGLCVGLIEGIMSRNFLKALRCGGIGVGIGLAWGFIGTMIGSSAMRLIEGIGLPLFLHATPKIDPSDPLSFLSPGVLFVLISARSLAWTIVGAGMGVGPGVALKSKNCFLMEL